MTALEQRQSEQSTKDRSSEKDTCMNLGCRPAATGRGNGTDEEEANKDNTPDHSLARPTRFISCDH